MTLRVKNVDTQWAANVVSGARRILAATAKRIEKGQIADPIGVRYSMFTKQLILSKLLYSLGENLEQTLEQFNNAFESIRIVFRDIHGGKLFATTTSPETFFDPKIDYSVANSNDGLIGIYLGFLLNNFYGAGDLALRIGDPPEAPYIHPKSEVCNPDQQAIAYAIRALYMHDQEGALRETNKVSDHIPGLFFQSKILKGIILGLPETVINTTREYQHWFASRQAKKRTIKHMDLLINIPAIALYLFAISQNICSGEELPGETNISTFVEFHQ